MVFLGYYDFIRILKCLYYKFQLLLTKDIIILTMKIRLSYILASILIFSIVGCENYTFVPLSNQRGAACLDGSPAGFFIHEGSNKKNFILYFNGGGYCGDDTLQGTLEDCYQRSFGKFGSTNNLPPFDGDQRGVLSTIKERNPIFYDWSKIVVAYCDGTEYLGSRPDPIPYKDRILHFRGANNTLQLFYHLQQNYKFYNGEKIVITGESAGGIATYMWSNHLMQNTISSRVYAMPDSGIFLTDYVSPITKTNIIRDHTVYMTQLAMTGTKYPIGACLQQFSNDYVKCFNAHNLIKYLKAPMLLIQSTYDSWSLKYMLYTQCLSSDSPFSINGCNQTIRGYIEDYSQMLRKAIIDVVKARPGIGAWAPACVQHGFVSQPGVVVSPDYKVPGTVGVQMFEAIQQFLQNPQNPPIYIDSIDWPLNKGCNGLKNRIQLRQ